MFQKLMRKISGRLIIVSLLLTIIFSRVSVREVSAKTSPTPVNTTTDQTANQNRQVKIIIFVREGCQHCAAAEKFLTNLSASRNDLEVEYLRLENSTHRQQWDEFTTRLHTSKVTPITVIGQSYLIGFDSDNTTGKQITNLIDETKAKNIQTDLNMVRADTLAPAATTCAEDSSIPCSVEPNPTAMVINLPFIGQINPQSYPLLILAALLGFVDGFNPCAMWVLVTFMLILLQVGSKQKMITFAGVFILAETIMYYLILTVWFKTWDFISLDQWITPLVGLIAIGAGGYFLWQGLTAQDECKVTDLEQRSKIRQKIMQLANEKFTLVTLIGILGLAFSVNIIEFACSIGIPQAFTKILEINQLPWLANQALILIYILFYMIDDFIVFAIAYFSVEKLALTTKYSKWSHLIGGILMIGLGLLMIFKPNWLQFG